MATPSEVRELPLPSLPDWLEAEYPFRRRLLEIHGHPMHLVDEGTGPVVFMLHGNPTWGYLWRKIMRRLQRQGFRLIVPDLIGFGLSEKPRDGADHTIDMHVKQLSGLVEALDLRDMTIVAQDWGGPLIAATAARFPERVRAAVFGNTALLMPKRPIHTTWFHRLSHYPVIAPFLFYSTMFPVPILHRVQGDPASIGPKEKRAYRYPFKSWSDRAGPLALARMVPNSESHPSIKPLEVVDAWTRSFQGPVSLVWGRRDPILGRTLRRIREALPQARVHETDAGHFLQEEVPDLLTEEILAVSWVP
ncbi:MAG: alpha/beta fold hydrolase [Planctomycetota bacterium]